MVAPVCAKEGGTLFWCLLFACPGSIAPCMVCGFTLMLPPPPPTPTVALMHMFAPHATQTFDVPSGQPLQWTEYFSAFDGNPSVLLGANYSAALGQVTAWRTSPASGVNDSVIADVDAFLTALSDTPVDEVRCAPPCVQRRGHVCDDPGACRRSSQCLTPSYGHDFPRRRCCCCCCWWCRWWCPSRCSCP